MMILPTTRVKGFSLIELMVVVAIIGILAAVALPNIQKYMNKSKQSEAKTNLSAIYMAEKTFHAEKNIYDATFPDFGYLPEGTFIYDIGFTSGRAGDLVNKTWGYCQRKSSSGGITPGFQSNQTSACTFTDIASTRRAITNAGVNALGFTAKANVFLRDFDTWSINHDKQLVHVSSGE